MGDKTEEDDAPGDWEAFGFEKWQRIQVPGTVLRHTETYHRRKDEEKSKHTEHAEPRDTRQVVDENGGKDKDTGNGGPAGRTEYGVRPDVIQEIRDEEEVQD